MAYRASGGAPPSAIDRPPPIFGFALYLLGAGCFAMGISELSLFAELLRVRSIGSLPWWASAVGQLMILVGLAVAWRTMKTTQRRLLAVATTLWLTLLVLDFQRPQHFAQHVLSHASVINIGPYSAALVGRAIALGLLAIVVHHGARAFAARTWATTLGVVLLIADAWARMWPVLLTPGYVLETSPMMWTPPSMISGGVGYLLLGGGLLVAGKTILGGITVEEYRRAGPKRHDANDANDANDASQAKDVKDADAATAAVRRGVPLLADALVSIAGVTLARALALVVAMPLGLPVTDVLHTAAFGGELVAVSLLVIALVRMRPHMKQPKQPLIVAYAVLGTLVAEGALLYVSWHAGSISTDKTRMLQLVAGLRFGLVGGALFSTSTALAELAVAPTLLARARRQLRFAALAVGAGGVLATMATGTPLVVASSFWATTAVLFAALGLYLAIGVAREARRIDVALAAPAVVER